MSLPPEIDFETDDDASPERMNRAMTYLHALARQGIALQPDFQKAIADLNAVGLARLNEVLTPIFLDAQATAAALDALEAAWLTGQPLNDLLASLTASINGQLAGNAASVAAQLAASNGMVANANTAVTAVNNAVAALAARTPVAANTAGDLLVGTGNPADPSAWSQTPLFRLRAERAFLAGGF